MKFQLQNNVVANIGDGRLDPRGVQYGDVLKSYTGMSDGKSKYSFEQSPTLKIEK